MVRNVKNSSPVVLSSDSSKLLKTLKNSKPSKVKITKATEEQIKNTKKIIIDSDTEDEKEDKPHYLEEVINNFVDIDFESKYRELLFNHNSLKEEYQGAKEEIESIEEQRDEARQKVLEIFEICKNKDDEIEHIKSLSDYAYNRIQEERENGKKISDEKQETIREKIQEIHSLKFQLEQAKADALRLNNSLVEIQKEAEEIKKLQDKKEILEDIIDDREIDIIFLKKEKNRLKLKLQNEESDNQNLIEERDELQERLEEMTLFRDDYEKNFFNLLDKNRELEKQKEKLYSDYLNIKEENGKIKNESWYHKVERERIKKELSDLQQRIRDGYEYDIHDIRQEQLTERLAYKDEIKNLKEDNKMYQNSIQCNNIIKKALETYLTQYRKYGDHQIKLKVFQNEEQPDGEKNNHIRIGTVNFRRGNLGGYGLSLDINKNEKKFISEMSNDYLLHFERELNEYIINIRKQMKTCKCCDNKICNDEINCHCDTYGCGAYQTCPKDEEMIKLKKFVEANNIKNVVSL
jgi:hypothetical protein